MHKNLISQMITLSLSLSFC